MPSFRLGTWLPRMKAFPASLGATKLIFGQGDVLWWPQGVFPESSRNVPFTSSSFACWNVDAMPGVGAAILGHEVREVTYWGAIRWKVPRS